MAFTTGSLVSRLPGTKTTSIAATLNIIRVTDKALGKAKYERTKKEETSNIVRRSFFVVNTSEKAKYSQARINVLSAQNTDWPKINPFNSGKIKCVRCFTRNPISVVRPQLNCLTSQAASQTIAGIVRSLPVDLLDR